MEQWQWLALLHQSSRVCLFGCCFDVAVGAAAADCASAACAQGLGAGGIVGIVLLCCVVVALGGYAAYRLRLRGMMQAEVRAIMAQYMELPGDDKMGGEMRRVENGS